MSVTEVTERGTNNMASRFFDLTWSDLSYEAQQHIIAGVKESLLESWETEGTGIMLKKWYVEPKTWQEAYCREYAIDHSMWSDLDEKSPEFQKIDWKYTLDEYAETEAEKKASWDAHYLELEVTL